MYLSSSCSLSLCHETIPLQAISRIPDSTSRGSRIISPSHALPSLSSTPEPSRRPRVPPRRSRAIQLTSQLDSLYLAEPTRGSAYNDYMNYEHLTPSYQTTEAISHLLPILATSLDQVTSTGQEFGNVVSVDAWVVNVFEVFGCRG